LRNRRRPPKSLLRSLRLFKEERALVIDRLLSVRSDWDRLHATALRISRRDFLNVFFDYALACVEGDQVVISLSFADEIRIIQELSEELGVGVATEHYRSKYTSNPPTLDPLSAANHFAVLRAAIAEDRGGLPRIRDIRHALALRRDPNLRSLRAMLVEFHQAVKVGDADSVASARHEVARAQRAMARRGKWQRGLDWVAYLALPVGSLRR
jgi:hypothetical protein